MGARKKLKNKNILGFGNRMLTALAGETINSFSKKISLTARALYSYRDGKSYPTLDRLAEISEATGKSITWLATGEDDFGGEEDYVDKLRLIKAIATVEKGLTITNRIMEPEKKASMIAAVYELYEKDCASEKTERAVMTVLQGSLAS